MSIFMPFSFCATYCTLSKKDQDVFLLVVMGQDMKNSKVRRFDIIARKMKSPQARSYIQPVGLVYDLSFILSCGLPRSLCPSLFNKIPIMAHLAADKGFTAVASFLAIGGSIAIDERLYIVCAKVEVKLYAV